MDYGNTEITQHVPKLSVFRVLKSDTIRKKIKKKRASKGFLTVKVIQHRFTEHCALRSFFKRKGNSAAGGTLLRVNNNDSFKHLTSR